MTDAFEILGGTEIQRHILNDIDNIFNRRSD